MQLQFEFLPNFHYIIYVKQIYNVMDVIKKEDLNGNHSREIYIKLHYPEFHKYLLENYPSDLKFKERMYWYFNGITERPVCKKCGKPTKFIGPDRGYCGYCSYQCLNTSEEKKTKTQQTNIERYGGVAPACSKEIQKKMKKTNLERYGSETYNNRESAQKTMIEKYGGVGNASPQIKEKQQRTLKERTGETNPMHIEEVKEKIRENNRKKYGVDWVFQRKDIRQKTEQTKTDRYGDPHYINIDKALNTIKEHNLEKYGVEYNLQQPQVREKSIRTCIERYGDPNYNNPEQQKQTMQEHFGTRGNFGRPEVAEQSLRTCIERYGDFDITDIEEIKKRYGIENHMQIPGVVEKGFQTRKENGTLNSSTIEKEFEQYLKENNIEYKSQYKSDGYPFFCDFYLPKYDLYIEIQGTWCHGYHPFDENNPEDIEKLTEWINIGTSYYLKAAHTWTIRDINKRNTAKNNKLNYLELFTTNIKIAVEQLNNKIKEFEK